MQFCCRPDVAEVELLLWLCYIALQMKGTPSRLLSIWQVSTQSILRPALWEAKKQLAFHTSLTANRDHLLQRPWKRSVFAGLIWLK